MTEVDRIQIHFQDFILGVGALNLDGCNDLLYFAHITVLKPHRFVQVAGQLLGQGTEALGVWVQRSNIDHNGPQHATNG